MKHQILITLDTETGSLNVDGQILGNKLITYGMMKMAGEALFYMYEKQMQEVADRNRIVVPSPVVQFPKNGG